MLKEVLSAEKIFPDRTMELRKEWKAPKKVKT